MPSPTLCYKWFLLILQPPVQWSPPQRGPGGSAGNEPACNVGDLGSIPVLGRSPGEGNSHPLQYSCLEKPMNRGAWRATVHGVTRSRTRLKQLSMHACMFSHYPFFFSCNKNFKDLSSQQLAHRQYRCINQSACCTLRPQDLFTS